MQKEDIALNKAIESGDSDLGMALTYKPCYAILELY